MPELRCMVFLSDAEYYGDTSVKGFCVGCGWEMELDFGPGTEYPKIEQVHEILYAEYDKVHPKPKRKAT